MCTLEAFLPPRSTPLTKQTLSLPPPHKHPSPPPSPGSLPSHQANEYLWYLGKLGQDSGGLEGLHSLQGICWTLKVNKPITCNGGRGGRGRSAV